MNRMEFVEQIAPKLGLSKAKTEATVDLIFGEIKDVLAGGDTVAISGFGKLVPVERAPRDGRNPKTGEKILIPATKSVKFTVSGTFKASLNA